MDASGATVLAGGSEPCAPSEAFARGHFFRPTVLAGSVDLPCFREEEAAPVVCVAPFDDETDAIASERERVSVARASGRAAVGEEPASPRYRAGVASMAWRTPDDAWPWDFNRPPPERAGRALGRFSEIWRRAGKRARFSRTAHGAEG